MEVYPEKWTAHNIMCFAPLPLFLCRLESIAAHRDHFVCHLSVHLSVCLSHFLGSYA